MYHSYKPITLTQVYFPAVTICAGLDLEDELSIDVDDPDLEYFEEDE